MCVFFRGGCFFLFSFQASAKRLFMFCFFSKDQNNWPPLGGVFFHQCSFFQRNLTNESRWHTFSKRGGGKA